MVLPFQTKTILQYLTVIILAVVLFFMFSSGISSGKSLAQSENIVRNTNELEKALDNFYKDQNRFPTAEEFADKNIMGQYLSIFPIQEFSSAVCSQTYLYKRLSAGSYQLNICVPKAALGFRAGWNQKTETK